jgi:hypothetical protein
MTAPLDGHQQRQPDPDGTFIIDNYRAERQNDLEHAEHENDTLGIIVVILAIALIASWMYFWLSW